MRKLKHSSFNTENIVREGRKNWPINHHHHLASKWKKIGLRKTKGLRKVKWSGSPSVVSNSLWPHGPYSPWNSPGQNTGVGSRSLLQGIFPTQGSNLCLLHCRWILYQLSHKGSPRQVKWHAKAYYSSWKHITLEFFHFSLNSKSLH